MKQAGFYFNFTKPTTLEELDSEAESDSPFALGLWAKEWQWLMNNSVKPLVEKPERKSKLNSQAKEAHFTDLIPEEKRLTA